MRPATVPPNSDHSDKSHRAQRAASSGAYRSAPHDGCTATRGCSETSRGRCELIPYPCDQQNSGQEVDATDCYDGTVSATTRRYGRGRGANSRPPKLRMKVSVSGAAEQNACYVAANMETIPRVFVPLWLVIIRPFCPPPHHHPFFSVGPLLNSPFGAGTLATSPPSKKVAFCFSPLVPGVNFLSCPVSDPEHSLPHSNRRHRSPAAPPTGPSSGRSRPTGPP